jgi:hypothetical protein
MVFRVITLAPVSSTERYPDINVRISKDHNSKLSIRREGIPIFRYSTSLLQLSLLGRNHASLNSLLN